MGTPEGSSQDSLAPPVPLSTQDVENYKPSPDLDAEAVPEYDEGEDSEMDAAGSDCEKEPLWSTTEPATSQELARLSRAKEVKAEAPEEELRRVILRGSVCVAGRSSGPGPIT